MTLTRRTVAFVLAATLSPLAVAPAHAQNVPPPDTPPPNAAAAPQRAFTQAELDQMLAPIALYPDALLSQILMAATYPLEVVEADRWSRANPGLQGDAAVRAVQNEDWDSSVKSLVAFPQILQRMDEQLRWTQSLGDAFLGQQAAVMDTVQQLRQRAQAAGNLRSTEQIRVEQQGPAIVIQSPPEVVYVPYYDPLVVYGAWWWPAYRPVAWAPWPGYVRAPGASVGFWFGRPSGVSLSFFFGDFDWGHRAVRVVRPAAYYYRPPTVVVNRTTVINRNAAAERNVWQHDPHHRRGVEYRAPQVRQQFANAQPAHPAVQRDARPKAEAQARPHPQPQPQRVPPQVRQEQRAEPRPQPQPQPQVKQEQRAVPHPQAKPRPAQRDEPRPERKEAQQDSPGGRGGERGERGNGKGGGERS